MKKMVAWMLIAYATLLIVGEKLRSHLYPKHSRKSKVFSGAFVFPKVNPRYPLKNSAGSWPRSETRFAPLFPLSELMSES